MTAPNMSTRRERLRDAKEYGYTRGGHRKESTMACVGRLAAYAARTTLVVFLIRSVITQDAPFFGGGGGGSNSTLLTTTTPKDSSSTTTTDAPKATATTTTTTTPAAPGTLRTYVWKNAGEDPVQASQQMQLPDYKHLLLLGDSAMSILAGSTQHHWQTAFPRAAPASKTWPCNSAGYFNLQQASVWVPPDFTKGEGPATQKTPFCSECTHCKSGRGDSGLGNPYAWEYINVDYARDVAQASTVSKTTQETIEVYLKGRNSGARLCVMNGGIQDMLIPGITKELYLKNLQEFLQKIVPSCQALLWLALSGTTVQPSTDVNKPQSNAQVSAWNTAVKEMMTKDSNIAGKVVYVDLYEGSLAHQHTDAIHMSDSWYLALARLWVQPLAAKSKQ